MSGDTFTLQRIEHDTYSPFHDDDSSIGVNNDPIQTTSDQQQQGAASAPKHPVALFFHFFFKVSAIVIYLLASLVGLSFVIAFIVITLCAAFDFWTVKNVSGRLLVGLRWWNEIKEDGTDRWIFESLENKSQINQHESFLFWVGVIGAPLVWILLTIFSIISLLSLSFGWLVVDVVCLALTGVNVIGYIKCAKDARKKVKGMAQSYIVGSIVNQAISRV
ncbi:hypothetical protein PPL_08150 [Heterostelium album PN500]|uniref:Golgi apparatus membrane protein TVP23 homolog n=1 Tax=Heterostelium pallidum (strain ATCC 26659 / Pp 5 / PN500) TaxID=670386 RepID=D3BIR5_HETP5|nr:hypothetical protein PPL_08150 [Heterostelium album PN500]EFA78689.1 hypothetical protein PPL_08150 [Heterostelium album PN500]|eukprot:XP_020430813.1 hypothetical protein PPL_08150 [Heterostelium album PN500]